MVITEEALNEINTKMDLILKLLSSRTDLQKDRVFDTRKVYTQKTIIDSDHLNINSRTFHKNYIGDKTFPKPYKTIGRSDYWTGASLQYWLDKKSGR